jgi:hypothetical protein
LDGKIISHVRGSAHVGVRGPLSVWFALPALLSSVLS